MAKLKPAKGRQQQKKQPAIAANPQAVGCIVILGLLLLFVMLSIYFTVANK
jgi:hypothetical protein